MTFNISSMLNPDVYNHPVTNIELIETHISWVVLTGEFAYKIKKPVNFGFLDFSTLKKRHACCQQELLLNKRQAEDIYLDVVTITGTADKPKISGDGKTFEYAVKMQQFQQSAQLDNMLADNKLTTKHMDAIAHMVANFHHTINVADDSMTYGDKESVYQPVLENFTQINENLKTKSYAKEINALTQWSHSVFTKLKTDLEQRKRNGFIRECHGDMHLRNLIWLNGRAMAFDCIEFNSNLRWIDVISDIAFLIMDLQDRQQQKLANRFLNSYLELTGDYKGLSILPFYLCYRAMVRAKVDALRLQQKNLTTMEKQLLTTEFKSYLSLATTYTQPTTASLIIMRGLSASGKSTLSTKLLGELSAIRIRSDVERKRLFDKTSLQYCLSNQKLADIDDDIYSAQATQKTYEKLTELASQIINAGYSVIIDATFLQFERRQTFQQLAKHLSVPYLIIETTAAEKVLRQRIVARKNDISDANLAVLEQQINNWQALHKNEINHAVIINTEKTLEINTLIDEINRRRSGFS